MNQPAPVLRAILHSSVASQQANPKLRVGFPHATPSSPDSKQLLSKAAIETNIHRRQQTTNKQTPFATSATSIVFGRRR